MGTAPRNCSSSRLRRSWVTPDCSLRNAVSLCPRLRRGFRVDSRVCKTGKLRHTRIALERNLRNALRSYVRTRRSLQVNPHHYNMGSLRHTRIALDCRLRSKACPDFQNILANLPVFSKEYHVLKMRNIEPFLSGRHCIWDIFLHCCFEFAFLRPFLSVKDTKNNIHVPRCKATASLANAFFPALI